MFISNNKFGQEIIDEDEAFNDDFDFGTIDESNKPKIDFTPDVDPDRINIALDEQYLRSKWRKELIISMAKWVASTLGLLFGVICFTLLGGYMFSSMELYNEIETCSSNRDQYYAGMDKAREAITATASNFQLTRDERLKQYEDTLNTFIEAFTNSSWSGDDCDNYSPSWDFIGSTFFCVTVVTSIGYGHIAPVTFWGRCVLIAYAVIGLPMFLAALAALGSFASAIVHYVYHNVSSYFSTKFQQHCYLFHLVLDLLLWNLPRK